MDNKKLLRALGILAVIVGIALALALSKSIFLDNASLSIEAQPTGPQIIAQTPVDGQRLDLSAPIEIQFDQDMDQIKTGDSFSLLNNGTAVPGQLTWDNARTLTFTPDSPLDPGTVYIATFSTAAIAQDGTSPQEIIEVEFKT
ncbi:MAG: Ig-like domain-containing protein, partial [Anaerolineales bacterium]|nr:Ig-like domain-containing protein [Anaerolineales bacterium]